MCGRFAVGMNAGELAQAAHDEHLVSLSLLMSRDDAKKKKIECGHVSQPDVTPLDDESWEGQRYNVAPRTRIPVLRQRGSDRTLAFELQLWGLIPHWTKKPDAVSQLKTINARDDSVLGSSSMWLSIRGRKRAVVFADGFYEWLKKGNERLPHFVKRSDGRPLVMAALWDSVTYEGEEEEIHSVTIVTTSSNKQLSFLHDRMPVILPDVGAMMTWLDTSSSAWTSDVAKLLKPFEGELDCYPVAKEVGKVGNNSKDFMIPISERKGNIHSFFAKAQTKALSPKKEERAQPTVNSESNAPPPPTPSPRKRSPDDSPPRGSHKKPKLEVKASEPDVSVIDVDSEDPVGDAKGEMAKTGTLDAFVKQDV